MSKHDKGRIGGQFTPLLWPTLELACVEGIVARS